MSDDWYPISSAPVNGERIRLICSTSEGPLEVVGYKDKTGPGWHIEPNGYWTSVTHWRAISPTASPA